MLLPVSVRSPAGQKKKEKEETSLQQVSTAALAGESAELQTKGQ